MAVVKAVGDSGILYLARGIRTYWNMSRMRIFIEGERVENFDGQD